MPSFEILADIFIRLSVFDSPKGSSDTFKTRENISLYFQRRHLIIIYKYGSPCPVLNWTGHVTVLQSLYENPGLKPLLFVSKAIKLYQLATVVEGRGASLCLG